MQYGRRVTKVIAVLAVIALLYFGGHVEWTMARQATGQPSTPYTYRERALADSNCFRQQGDGCWPQVYVEDKGTDEPITALNER